MTLFRSVVALLLVLLLGACGFQLKGDASLPYKSIYISLPENSVLGADLRRQIRANSGTVLADNAKDAEAVFIQISETRDRIIASLNSQGRAREYQLRLRYSFRLADNKGNLLIPVSNISLAREVTYDDNQVLSKAQEEEFLWQDMQRDLAQQILRRISTARPTVAAPVEEDDY